ncbi:hypothetical protein Tco_0536911 [Tanacetum coccineum]
MLADRSTRTTQGCDLEIDEDTSVTWKANPIAKKVAGTVTVNNDGAPLPGGGGGVVPPEVMVGGEVGLELGDEVGGQGSVGVMGGLGVIDGGVGVAVGGGDVGVIGVVDGGVAVELAETIMVNFDRFAMTCEVVGSCYV